MQRREKVATLLVAAAFAIVCWISPAKADGLPKSGLLPLGEVGATGSWSGFYVGIHGGYGWGEWDGNMLYTDAGQNDGFDATGKTIKSEGTIAGGQIGFNVQSGKIVWGLEADASWSDISGGATLLPYPNNAGSPAWGFESQINWLATVRARLGFTSGSVLIYGTGGVAFAEVDSRLSVFATGPENAGHVANGAKNETKTGWTVGGGFEWMLAKNWTLRTEYLYVNLGEVGGILPGEQSTSCGPPCSHQTDGFSGDLDLHVIRAGLNFKLN